MKEMYEEALWQKRCHPRELYPNVSSKDALIPPDLPVPNCDYGSVADRLGYVNPNIQTQLLAASIIVSFNVRSL
jgi:hypothetical protein